MASFKMHISFGALLAMVGVVLAYYYAIVTSGLLLFLMFAVTVVASFLPDLDSDSGLPVLILLGLVTLFVAGLGFYTVLILVPESMLVRFGVPLGLGLFVWFGLGTFFKKLTHHRGMFHSLPAMGIAGLVVYVSARSVFMHDFPALALGVATGLGYLSHLVLDEVYAGVNIHGKLFKRNKSLGTALKLLSSSNLANMFTYSVLVLLVYVAVK